MTIQCKVKSNANFRNFAFWHKNLAILLLHTERVVSSYLEFFGEGARDLTIGDRATISNMTPEYGATAGMFYIDEQTINYLKLK